MHHLVRVTPTARWAGVSLRELEREKVHPVQVIVGAGSPFAASISATGHPFG